MRWILPIAMILVLVACGDSGTEEPDPAPDAKTYTHEIGADTEWYLASPAQAMPPNGTIPAGTKANVVQDAGSYTLVETESGIEGFVSTSALKKLP